MPRKKPKGGVFANYSCVLQSNISGPCPKEVPVVSVKYDPPTLDLTEEEAFALLSMCLLTSMKLDRTAELALKKLADFCKHEQYFPQAGERGEPPK
jgi:hypothetical protein